MREKIKFFLLNNTPFLFNLIRRLFQNYRDISYKIYSEFLHIHLDKKTKGASITPKERGFVVSFIRDNYLTLHLRPKKASNVDSDTTELNDSFAIVIQGPIGKYYNFLFESIKLYKKTFPGATIIISTWDTEKKAILESIENLGVIVLLSNLASIPWGFGNINLQMVSAHKGIEYASNNGIKYCIKTRTDCRMYHNNIAAYLVSTLNSFPLNKNPNSIGRIVATSVNTCKYKVYGITDILLFGYTKDLELYFQPFKNRSFEEELESYGFGKFPAIINGTPVVSETFLCARYLMNMGVKLDWTLEHWWECLKNYFIVIDADSIDLFWYKTDWPYEKRFYRSYASKSHRAVEFSDWLTLYTSKNISWSKVGYQEKWIVDNSKSGNEIFKKISIFYTP
jgi:hypothetical protein